MMTDYPLLSRLRLQTGKIYSNNYKDGSSRQRLINLLGEVTESKSTPGDIRRGESHLRVGRCHGSAVAGPGLSKYLCTDRRRGTTRRSPTCPRRAVISLRLGTDSLWGEQEFSCKTRPKRSAPKEHETNGGR
jgi:hypothetical protein